jgi:myosin heavy subunit
MSRERLTTRTAEDLKAKAGTQVSDKGSGIDNDTAAMNNPDHTKNDPAVGEYARSGDSPEGWAEGKAAQNWPSQPAGEKREDTGHAAITAKQAAEAVASAKRLEEKAVKCIIAAQRILPGAAEEMIEKQAAIFMHLPEEGLNATLTHQETLAKQIAKQAGDVAEEAKAEGESEEQEKKEKECVKDEDEQKKEAAKKEMDDKKKKLEDLKKEASDLEREITAGQNADANKNFPQGKKKTEKDAAEEDKKEEEKKEDDKKEDKAAASEEDKKEEDKKEDDKKEDKVAASEEEKKEEDKKEDDKKDDKKEDKAATEIEASDSTLLDQIFGEVTASETKKGASKLSGMVKKQASEQVNDLAGLWASAPDVSNMF